MNEIFRNTDGFAMIFHEFDLGWELIEKRTIGNDFNGLPIAVFPLTVRKCAKSQTQHLVSETNSQDGFFFGFDPLKLFQIRFCIHFCNQDRSTRNDKTQCIRMQFPLKIKKRNDPCIHVFINNGFNQRSFRTPAIYNEYHKS
ncbi:hypothetical protein D3C80_1543340 [compost metagenome]